LHVRRRQLIAPRTIPLLLDETADAPIRRNAIRELVIAQLVIVVKALLVHTSPMGG